MLKSLTEKLNDMRDAFADRIDWRVIRDPLVHPKSDNVTTLDVVGYRQLESYTCGFAAGLIVLHTFHPKRSIKAFFDLVAANRQWGTQDGRLIKSLRASGVGVAERNDLTFAKICKIIDDGFPIITLVRSRERGVLHWVVLYGYGVKPNRVFIAGEGPHLIGHWLGYKEALWSDFKRKKWSTSGFGLVCWGK